ncbi:hypothetical protein BES08_16625 [Novosphingobium resinovorum]|uniref:Uncharacterized protein n=1 Tax=Novosphingobium resinovorum TaxID=158500 RepID=A0A1D8A7W7_9SPHN|nr:hypothetical protein BES08_16625 [Novosphingobium resinovorum]
MIAKMADHQRKSLVWPQHSKCVVEKTIEPPRGLYGQMIFRLSTDDLTRSFKFCSADLTEPAAAHFASGSGKLDGLGAAIVLVHLKPGIRETRKDAKAQKFFVRIAGPAVTRSLNEHLV